MAFNLSKTLAGAASAGLMLGALSACAGGAAETKDPATAGDKACCKGKNECAGKGSCAVEGKNACAGKNTCRGQGGCNAHCPQ